MFKHSLKPYKKYRDSGIDWLGEIPNHWEVIKIKRIANLKRGASPRPIDSPIFFNKNGKYSWVRISDVSSSGKYLEKTTQKLSILGSSLSVKIHPGDIFVSICATVGKPIISKINCCIHDGFVWFRNLKINPEFLYYIFLTGEVYKGLGNWGTQLNLNTDIIGNIIINIPTIAEQQKISNYLNRKTKQADNFIEKQTRFIELLKEQKKAIINKAVTKGLNSDVPIKDSGIEWLGEIPAHWEVRKLKHCVQLISEQVDKKSNNDIFISLERIESWTGKFNLEIGNDEIESGVKKFQNRDILFGRLRPYLAKVVVPSVKGVCGSELLVFRPSEYVLPEYFKHLLLSEVIINLIDGSTFGAKMPRASWDFIGQVCVPFFHITEQHQIVSHIQTKTTKINQAIEKAEKEIILVKEYLQSLIYHVVIGKLEIKKE